ncbi:hypothetical protein WDU94_004294 [Cyamophila willieti]
MTTYRSPSRLVRFWNGPQLYVLIGDASVAFQVNDFTVQKPEFMQYLGGLYFKQGLVSDSCSSDTAHWRWARKTLQPAFNFTNFKQFIAKFHKESLITAKELEQYALTGHSVFLLEHTRNYAYRTIMRTMFDYELNQHKTEEECQMLLGLLEAMFQHFQNRMTVPIYRNLFIYYLTGLRQKENEEMKMLMQFVREVIDLKKTNMDNDISGGLCTNQEDNDQTFVERMLQNPEVSMEELIVQGATIITAGIDTTKSQNIVILLMLALHPDIQNNVYKELMSILDEDITLTPSYEAVCNLSYLDRVIKETLRMYPAAPVLARKAYSELTVTADDGEYTIPAGTVLLTMVTDIHNNPDYYDNPHVFDPDRWLDRHLFTRQPHCYLPFSSGARNCLGYKYALLQMKLLVATLVRTYEILPSETCHTLDDIKFDMSITIKIEETCRLRFKPRRIL